MKRLFTLVIALAVVSSTAWAQKFALPQGGYDGRRVLLIGNSFTYFHDCDSMLLQISRSQGLDLTLGEFLKGGQTFGQHLNLPRTSEAIAAGSYRYAFIQDQSSNAARYSRDKRKEVLENAKELKRRILQASPDCQVILERTWSFEGEDFAGFGSLANLDRHIEKGTAEIARKADVWRSPIGIGFNTVRAERPDINLFDPDRKHQSAAGSYLKCCINYLVITGKPFRGTVATCGVDPEVAAYLQKVAERTVLGHEKEYRIKR